MSITSVTNTAEHELRDHSRIDRLDLELTQALKGAVPLVGDVVWGELAELGVAVHTIDQASGLVSSEPEWERMLAAVALVETATGKLYDRARQELRRFEQCDTPGPAGCLSCDACRAWGDEQHDARGER